MAILSLRDCDVRGVDGEGGGGGVGNLQEKFKLHILELGQADVKGSLPGCMRG